ncbi:MAG: GNAT family N-acetyltransferase [Acidobacteriota bacterium]|nr:GNAT family N-acetyltransferase [Acidobacteriota bacterium]
MSEPALRVVAASRLHDLRRRVLRGGDASAVVANTHDDDPTSLHVAVVLGDDVLASASYFLEPSPDAPGILAYQVRYVATDPAWQGRGLGAAVLAAGEEELRRRGVALVWANARDSALDFYRHRGWTVVEGSAHVSAETQLPHHRIFKELIEAAPTTSA